MKNLSEMRAKTAELIRKLESEDIDKSYVDSFCKLSHLILSSIETELTYIKQVNSMQTIDFIENKSLKQIT